MARPVFENPDFLEDTDTDDIQERMMDNLPQDISQMEGDFPYDFTMPTAIELSQLYQEGIVQALMAAFPEYASDEILDLHGADAGLTRKAALRATGVVQVTAEEGTMIEAGTVFLVPATDAEDAIEFTADEDVEWEEDGTLDVPITAVDSGSIGNVSAGTISIMEDPIDEVSAVINADPTTGGIDEEEDDDFYERIHAENADSNSYTACDSDLRKWALMVDGIGDCIVDPAWNGPGTVRLILVDSNGQPASATLVQAVSDKILSPNDRSARLLPAGSASLTCVAATTVTVNYVATGLVLVGTTAATVSTAFQKAVKEIYASAKSDNILRYAKLYAALANIDGVVDFATFLVNNGEANISLGAAGYAVTGTVSFSV